MDLHREKLTIRFNKNDLPTIEDRAFILFFSGIPLHALIMRVVGVIGLSSIGGLIVLAMHVVTALLIIAGFAKIGRKNRADTIILYFVIGLIFLFSYLLNPEVGSWFTNEEYGIIGSVINLEGGVFAGGILGYVVIRIQKNPSRIFYSLKICNVFWILYLLMLALNRFRLGYFEISYVNGQMIQLSYHMSFGYYCTFISLLNFSLWKREKKIVNLIIGIIFALMSIAFGARGVLIVYAFFLISLIWIALRETTLTKKLLFTLLIAAITFFAVSYFTEILFAIQQILKSFGVSDSRTLTSLLSGEISEANGRDRIWTIAVDMIKSKFPFGFGAYGERPTVGPYYGWGYCHNIFLELIIAFGLIGAVICIYMVYKAIRIINNTTDKEWNLLFVMFFANCGMLLISSSFWYHAYFWATIAIGFSYMRELKTKKNIVL